MAALHTCRKEMDPNSTDPSGSGNKYAFCWSSFKSQTTQDLTGTESRSIAWASGDRYAQAKKFCAYWTWKPIQGRSFGRVLNFHSNPKRGGWNPDGTSNSYVSPVALDCYGSLKLSLAANNWWDEDILSDSEMGVIIAAKQRIDIVLEIGIGRPGYAKVWVNGETNPRINVNNVNTHWNNQTGYAPWEGLYNSNGVSATHIAEYAPMRVGVTHQEAQKDGVDWSIEEKVVWGGVKQGSGTPAHRHTVITPSWDTSQFRIPPSLGGDGGTTPPPPTELTLKKVSETSDKIVLGWDWVPAGTIGFRYQSATSQPKWSHTWDADKRTVSFSKADWYKVQALTVGDEDMYP